MNRVLTQATNAFLTLFVVLGLGSLAAVAEAKPRPEIMGVALSMSREVAQARLKTIGRLVPPTPKSLPEGLRSEK